MNPKFKQTINLFQKLPGVGPRQAARFILALLEKDQTELKEFGQAIVNLRNEIRFCRECFNISAASPKTDETRRNGRENLCDVCRDTKRDKTKILVVEKVTDLDSIEKTGLYKGLYHVLGGAIDPLDGMTPETLRFKELARRVDNISNDGKNIELIIATNPNTNGETTALYIKELLQNRKGVELTRLGRGLASGSHLEYADEITLKNALDYRK